MAMRYTIEGWEFEPPSSCYIGAGSQSTQQSSQGSGSSQQQSLTLPSNLQNPAFTANAPNTVAGLNNVAGTAGIFANAANPFGTNNMTGAGPTAAGQNPLVAPVTSAQNQTLGEIGTLAGNLPNNLAEGFQLLSNEMSPNFASSLATSPQTQAAEQAAIQPISTQFNTQTVPGLQGSFTQAGQRVGSASGMGSSAFDAAFGNAQAQELATEAATTGQIANNAYQTGLNIQANAPGQAASLGSSELGSLVSALNAQALPQLTQQYGISAGTQLYQQQMSQILQALGLSVQGEQPAIGYGSESSGTSTEQSSSQGTGSGSNFTLGGGLANAFSGGGGMNFSG